VCEALQRSPSKHPSHGENQKAYRCDYWDDTYSQPLSLNLELDFPRELLIAIISDVSAASRQALRSMCPGILYMCALNITLQQRILPSVAYVRWVDVG
jgi:hypothetical protein